MNKQEFQTNRNDPAIPFLGTYWKDIKSVSQRNICLALFITELFTITKTWKKAKFPSTDELIKKMFYTPMPTHPRQHTHTHTRILFSHTRKEILQFATTWMNLEDIMLSEMSQTQKEKNSAWSHLYVESKKVELTESESMMVVARG